jgi:probable HAF family extracellular repeat protein
MRILVCVVGLLIVLMCTQVCLAGGASFRGLGHLPGGIYYSQAYRVSAYGNAVVGYSDSASGIEAFIWTEANGMVGLGTLPSYEFGSMAFGVSCDGSFIAGMSFVNGSLTVPCRWSGPNNIRRLGQGGEYGYAFGISADGSTVVGTTNGAFRWTEATGMQSLGYLPEKKWDAEAWGVSANGYVIVGTCYGKANRYEAFRWTEATGMVGLGSLQDGNSIAYDVSEDGLVVVGWSDGQAFIWTEAEGMRGIGNGEAWGVSGDGTVVVGADFIWDANHGMQNPKNVLENAYGLDLTGWQLGYEVDISADGKTLAGTGTDPNGNTQAWVAVLGDHAPSVKLTVQVEPNNLGISTVTPSIGEHIYYKNWPVVIKADTFKKCPDVYRFSHWVGDVAEPNSATITLVMTENKTVTAVYSADQRRCGDECHPILQGDINKDCHINFEDFMLFVSSWLSCTAPECD